MLEEGLSVSNLPSRADLRLRSFGVPKRLQFKAKYTLLQQKWSQPLRIVKYMDEPIINRIKHQENCIPDYEPMLRGRTLLCTGTQLLNDNLIWSVIKNIVGRVNAEDREL